MDHFRGNEDKFLWFDIFIGDLIASPFVKFEPPYLLTRAREMERRLSYLKSLRDQDRCWRILR
jgi:hypothetical protein